MNFATERLIVGTVIALAVILFARASSFDRSKAFYPTVLIVTASYYVLFAVIYGGGAELIAEPSSWRSSSFSRCSLPDHLVGRCRRVSGTRRLRSLSPLAA